MMHRSNLPKPKGWHKSVLRDVSLLRNTYSWSFLFGKESYVFKVTVPDYLQDSLDFERYADDWLKRFWRKLGAL